MNNHSCEERRNTMEQENNEFIVNIEKVNKIKKIMPSDDLLFDIAEVFKVFGDTTRMKIISALLESELCVGDISEITNSTQSAISHQLRVLKQAKLVKFRKDGKTVYYSLDDEHIAELYEIAKKHIEEGYKHR
jgi:DNA-binding transcriptional ArsR family regulator